MTREANALIFRLAICVAVVLIILGNTLQDVALSNQLKTLEDRVTALESWARRSHD